MRRGNKDFDEFGSWSQFGMSVEIGTSGCVGFLGTRSDVWSTGWCCSFCLQISSWIIALFAVITSWTYVSFLHSNCHDFPSGALEFSCISIA